jgi:hypothetical protein
MRQAELKRDELEKKYKTIVSDDKISPESELGQSVAKMREENAAVADTSLRTVDVLQMRGDELAKVIMNGGGPGFSAVTATKDRIDQTNARLKNGGVKGIDLKPDNLLGNIELLANAVIDRDRTSAATSDKLNKQLSETKSLVAAAQEGLSKADEATKAAQADAQKAKEDANTAIAAANKKVDDINNGVQATVKDYSTKIESINVELTTANTKVADLTKQNDRLKALLALRRQDTKEPTVRRTDGVITRVSDDGKSVYINRGSGDQISPGLTFEVYDRNEGVPALGDGMREEDMPVGKGSIEVINIGATSSECRIVKTTPGMTISVGDPIANLVYDPNLKYNFMIYGKFDLDHNKVSTDQETDVIKRLVTQWGGKVVDKVDIDTDFVVLGTEPTLPNYSEEEKSNPEIVKKIADATAEIDAYNKVRADAKDLHIPVMNQNRFLYFVGYYDQAKR